MEYKTSKYATSDHKDDNGQPANYKELTASLLPAPFDWQSLISSLQSPNLCHSERDEVQAESAHKEHAFRLVFKRIRPGSSFSVWPIPTTGGFFADC
jgi:hypothetical protein